MPPRFIDSQRPAIARLLAVWPARRIDQEIRLACQKWGCAEFAQQVTWQWNPRLRTTLGRARIDDFILEFNAVLLARHPDEMLGLLHHELAHIVAYAQAKSQRKRIAPHGREWKALMVSIGASTRATHQLDVSGLRSKRKRSVRRKRGRTVLRRGLSQLLKG